MKNGFRETGEPLDSLADHNSDQLVHFTSQQGTCLDGGSEAGRNTKKPENSLGS
jgi:hypothetical protein